MARRALEMRKKHLGELHVEISRSLDVLAFILQEKGDLEQTEAVTRRSLYF